MKQSAKILTDSPEWQALKAHQASLSDHAMQQWFSEDLKRFESFSIVEDELLLDYSRNLIQEQTLDLLCQLAQAANLSNKINALFTGQPINLTEARPALHTALRDKKATPIIVDGQNIALLIQAALEKMENFTNAVHEQRFQGVTGQPITDVINIGIGGSYLGPMMCTHALRDFASSDLRFHFVSGMDESYLQTILQQINPETTLFIISSKSFSTLETLTNAKLMADWLKTKLGETAIQQQFLAITAQPAKALQFGIHAENIFPLWEWVGGRYSIWSAIGLPLMLMIGAKQFKEFLNGAHAMDEHFRSRPFQQNMPVILGLISIWYVNFFGAQAKAIVPYGQPLSHLTAYLQQAEMESNGKSVSLEGGSILAACPVIFGGEGCNGQHAYHQLLHQGKQFIPVDFILSAEANDLLLASALSQAQALLIGKSYQEAYQELLAKKMNEQQAQQLAQHLVIPGNRPSNILLLSCLSPKNLGALLALYEHQIFVEAAIWNINPFDQWGVELGKQLLPAILKQMHTRTHDLDATLQGFMDYLKKIRG